MKNIFLYILCALLFSAAQCLAEQPDIVFADFEGSDYGSWKVEGTAFGSGPAHGTLERQMAVEGFLGKGLVNSFNGGDDATGKLTSPSFTIERGFITFLIGGGGWANETCMNLLVDEKIVRTATGPNTTPGGSEHLDPAAWDVHDLVGKTAHIEIVDQRKGGWGHINVDQIVFSDSKPPMMVANAKRDILITQRLLNFPVKTGAPRRLVKVIVDGKVERFFDIELADGRTDWWAPLDVSAWNGKTIAVVVDKLMDNSKSLALIDQSDTLKNAGDLYHEPLRPQLRFSPQRGWTNDPNGMVFFNGEYHLFFQHNPYGWNWGNMHWGHATSRDLVHWQEHGDALCPDELGPMFSGSAVVDWKNTSGFGKDGKPPLVLIYTAAGNPTVQCIAYSTDGRTFTKYAGNPVVKQISGGNRDPKVYWHEPTQKWVMALYVGLGNENTIHFLTSPNLKDWTVAGHTAGFFECPDYFELAVDGDAKNKKWVLTAASSEYMVGSFDGTNFTPETPKLPGQLGDGFYAAQTFADIPHEDGRRIQIGWFQTNTPGMPFNQSMTIPLELKLISTPGGPRLARTPVKELEVLRTKAHVFEPTTLKPDSDNPLAKVNAELVELRTEFEPGEANEVVLTVRGATIVYDAKKQELIVNGKHAHAPLHNGKQRITIYCDRVGLEVFASDGLTYMPMPFIPRADDVALSIQAKGGNAKLDTLQVYELESIWK